MKTCRILASILALVLSVGFPVTAAERPHNIVVIVADDLGYADVLFNPLHPKEVTTPQLDSLAKESVICRRDTSLAPSARPPARA